LSRSLATIDTADFIKNPHFSSSDLKEIYILHSFVLPNNRLVHSFQPGALRWLREIVCPYFEKVEDIFDPLISTIATSRPEDTPKGNCFAPIARLLREDSSLSVGQPRRNVDCQDAVRNGMDLASQMSCATLPTQDRQNHVSTM
jgi:hypothetical protein